MNVLLATLLTLLPTAIFLVGLSCGIRDRRPLVLCVWLYLAFLCQVFILTLPHIDVFADFSWNWQGKILGFFWLLLWVYPFKLLTAKEIGLIIPPIKLTLLYALLAGIIFNAVQLPFLSLFNDVPPLSQLDNESIFFQLLMPGLEEELFYRGVLWAI